MSSSTETDGRKRAEGDEQSGPNTAVRRGSRLSGIPWDGAIAIGIVVVVNGLLFLIAKTAGAFPPTVTDPGSGQPFTVVTVVLASAVGAVGATVVYAAFDRFVADADRWFRIVAGIVLLASFATPFSVPGASPATIGTLLAMHVVVAGVSVWMLTFRGEN